MWVSARQQAYQRCTEMKAAGDILRDQGICTVCGKAKIVNWRAGERGAQVAVAVNREAREPVVSTDRPWYWEGNVQVQIVSYLQQQGYKITRTADTASREAGKDIVAVGPDGRELWVSVKGFPTPKGSTTVQARHWFSHVIFDIVLYHGENPAVDLAIGLPDGYRTYQTLAERVAWFRQSLPFRIFWVSEDGRVRVV